MAKDANEPPLKLDVSNGGQKIHVVQYGAEMNPSFFRIKLSMQDALPRLALWLGINEVAPWLETDSVLKDRGWGIPRITGGLR